MITNFSFSGQCLPTYNLQHVFNDPNKAQEIFAHIDVNNDGRLDFVEFAAWVAAQTHYDYKASMRGAKWAALNPKPVPAPLVWIFCVLNIFDQLLFL
jgi:hypothetical protein